ncbi:uncharacterized protein LOC129919492 [Episyrphus balteatus]|uniref:uncharacterized protein LOC129919492 n=1 Tax=Episyrphus balteatus TaxID=286459 RepID=UPI0024863435|nr:uncharacterized protein LOC129919492 [Episyrphus balteatus]
MMLKIFVLLFFSFYIVSALGDDKTSVIGHKENPCSRNTRPRQQIPLKKIQFNNKIYDGGRHHIIPYSVIRKFFDFAIAITVNSEAKGTERMKNYISNFIDKINADFIKNGVSIRIPKEAGRLLILDPLEEMCMMLAWLPGNIFIGPNQELRRHDKPKEQSGGDPGDGFEEYANRIIKDNQYFTALKNLYSDMDLFVKPPLDKNLFEKILRNLNIVKKKDKPFPFDARDWEMVKVEREIRKKVNGKTTIEKIKEDKFKIRE